MAEAATLTADDARTAAQSANAVLGELRRVILGHDEVLREALLALLARGHVLLEGPPGTAKTLLVRSLNQALGLEFRRIQFTPDLMPSDITGVSVLTTAAGPPVARSCSGPAPSSPTSFWPTKSIAPPPRRRRRCSKRWRSAPPRSTASPIR